MNAAAATLRPLAANHSIEALTARLRRANARLAGEYGAPVHAPPAWRTAAAVGTCQQLESNE